MKVVIDTNIWISQLISGNHSSFFQNLSSCSIFVSEELIDEIRETGVRPKFKKYFQEADLEIFLMILLDFVDLLAKPPQQASFQDPKDEFLLDLCVAAQADYLVTGDKPLLDLAKYEQTEIISLATFKELLKE